MLIKNDTYGPSDLGYFLIDNRASGDLPPGCRAPVFEADTYTCRHCEAVVVMNPDRKRERYKCVSCSHHICDPCAALMAAGKECYPFKKYVEDSLDALAKVETRPTDATLILPQNPLER